MKIKRERQVRLDELVDYIWKNNIKSKGYTVKMMDKEVRVFEDGRIETYAGISEKDLFTITEEVEIDEDTQLNLVDIYKDYGLPLEVAFCKNTSVKEILKLDKESGIDTKFIHIQNPDGSIGELIWTKERGLVE